MPMAQSRQRRPWFPKANHGPDEVNGLKTEWRPASLVHAKEI